MYAVIELGGKQYRVSPGETLELELLPALPGSEVSIDRVLLVSTGSDTLVGKPLVPGGRVIGTVIREGRGKKVLVFKFRAKKRYRRLNGHRQDYTYLAVTDIQANGESLVEDGERKRFERIARRAANRFDSQLLEQLSSGLGLITEEVEPRRTSVTPAIPKPRETSTEAKTFTSELSAQGPATSGPSSAESAQAAGLASRDAEDDAEEDLDQTEETVE